MIDIGNIREVYFIGIGGIGMSALARYFHMRGKIVSGYDRTETPLTRQLVQEGIRVTYSEAESEAPKSAELVVYTPAVPADHPQLSLYRSKNYQLVKRSEVLGAITAAGFNICVAGTHGKTTISTMIAHLLRDSGHGCNAFLGGIAANYNTNFWSSSNDVFVAEADEYDRSFLKLSPNIAVISAMDADHLDIYGNEEEMRNAFVQFTERIKPGGLLVVKKGLARYDQMKVARKVTYGLNFPGAEIQVNNVRLTGGKYVFDIKVPGEEINDVELNMGGLHNVENASVAIFVAMQLNVPIPAIRKAVAAFKGVKRRFEYIVKTKNTVYIDDYAHHPAELDALITSARALFPQMKCTVVFQPHLFSRTRDLADGFASSLQTADEVILLPIYPARELPIEGVTSEMIARKIKGKDVAVISKEEVPNKIGKRATQNQLLITAGAGDIDTLVEPLRKIINAMN